MELINSDRLAEIFIQYVIQYDNQGILQDVLEGWMKKTKFCGLPKLFLAKKLGRKYGILLYEKPTTVLATGKKVNLLFIDTVSAKKLCVSAKPRNAKLVKCYIGANILTYAQVENYKKDHNLQSVSNLIKVVDSQQAIKEYDGPDKSKISFFIAPKDDEIEKRKNNLSALKISNDRNCSRRNSNGNGRIRNISSIFRNSRSLSRSGNGNGNGSRRRGNIRNISSIFRSNTRELESPTRELSEIEPIYNF